MMKTSLVLVVALAATAHAGGAPNSLGLGAEYQLSGLGGLSLEYDGGKFHAGGFIAYDDPTGGNNTVVEFGGRFFYHVHSTAMSDFGIGGSVGIESVPAGMNTRDDLLFIEPSFQIRLFVASNVAFSFTAGMTIGTVDASGVAVTGQGVGGGGFSFDPVTGLGFLGGAGVHYYFF